MYFFSGEQSFPISYPHHPFEKEKAVCKFTLRFLVLQIIFLARNGSKSCERLHGWQNSLHGFYTCLLLYLLRVHPMPCKVVHFCVRKSPSQSDE